MRSASSWGGGRATDGNPAQAVKDDLPRVFDRAAVGGFPFSTSTSLRSAAKTACGALPR